MLDAFYNSLVFLSNQLLTDVVLFLPKLFIGIVILVVGSFLAQTFSKVVMQVMRKLHISQSLRKTPIEYFINNAGWGEKVDEVFGAGLYWLVMLVVIHAAVAVLGLTSISVLIGKILAYIPAIVSAVIILFFGLLIAGLVESLVKGAVRSIDGKSARPLATVASYSVMVITVLAAISELGIAQEFVFTLFVGFVAAVSLGLGLAIGLGSKDLVKTILLEWHKKAKEDSQK